MSQYLVEILLSNFHISTESWHSVSISIAFIFSETIHTFESFFVNIIHIVVIILYYFTFYLWKLLLRFYRLRIFLLQIFLKSYYYYLLVITLYYIISTLRPWFTTLISDARLMVLIIISYIYIIYLVSYLLCSCNVNSRNYKSYYYY